jgi:hypothetical protein
MLPDRLLNTQEAARYLAERGTPIAEKTLRKLRCVGGGPSFRRWGRLPVYEPEALDRWREEKLSLPKRSTSTASRN